MKMNRDEAVLYMMTGGITVDADNDCWRIDKGQKQIYTHDYSNKTAFWRADSEAFNRIAEFGFLKKDSE